MPSALPLLLEQYKIAWESHDLDLLESIFTVDTVYQEKTDCIFYGMSQLKAYWQENKAKQENVQFRVRRHLTSNNHIVAEWEAEFWDRIKKKVTRLSGLMWLTLCDGKISFFQEFFSKSFET